MNVEFQRDFALRNHDSLLRYRNSTLARLVVPGAPPLPFAACPVVLSQNFFAEAVEAIHAIGSFTISDLSRRRGDALTPAGWAGMTEAVPPFMCVDFAIADDGRGNLVPKLIEAQAFPSVYASIIAMAEIAWAELDMSDSRWPTCSDDCLDPLEAIQATLGATVDAAIVDLSAHQQRTYFDFIEHGRRFGTGIVAAEDLVVRHGRFVDRRRNVAYEKIINRLAIPEVPDSQRLGIVSAYGAPWVAHRIVGHPSWYFRLNKGSLTHLPAAPWLPFTRPASDLTEADWASGHFVLKPISGFGGAGIVMPGEAKAMKGKDLSNYVAQESVSYPNVVHGYGKEPCKGEVRLFAFWPKGEPLPRVSGGLARLFQGNFAGVSANLSGSVDVGMAPLFIER